MSLFCCCCCCGCVCLSFFLLLIYSIQCWVVNHTVRRYLREGYITLRNKKDEYKKQNNREIDRSFNRPHGWIEIQGWPLVVDKSPAVSYTSTSVWLREFAIYNPNGFSPDPPTDYVHSSYKTRKKGRKKNWDAILGKTMTPHTHLMVLLLLSLQRRKSHMEFKIFFFSPRKQ